MSDFVRSSNLPAAGEMTAARGLDAFTNRFSNLDDVDSVNASKLMDELSSETEALLSSIKIASVNHVSPAGAVVRQAALIAQSISRRLVSQNHLLGIYVRHSLLGKQR